MGLLAAGSALSITAPSAGALAAGQALVGAASSLVVAAGVAAAAEWTAADGRERTVAWALVGAPTAWIVGMPVVGLLASASWRAALALPVLAAVAATLALRAAPATLPAANETRIRSALRDPALRRWAIGEAFAYAAWGGVLAYAGALLVESYDASVTAVGVALGIGATAYIPGTFAARAARAEHAAPLLAAAGALLAVGVTMFGLVRTGVGASTTAFALLCFLSGARVFLGSSVGLALAGDRHVAAMALRAVAAQVGWVGGAAVGGARSRSRRLRALGVALGVALRRQRRALRVLPGRPHPSSAYTRHSSVQLRDLQRRALAEAKAGARQTRSRTVDETMTSPGPARFFSRVGELDRDALRASRRRARIRLCGGPPAGPGRPSPAAPRGRAAQRIARAGPSKVATSVSVLRRSSRPRNRADVLVGRRRTPPPSRPPRPRARWRARGRGVRSSPRSWRNALDLAQHVLLVALPGKVVGAREARRPARPGCARPCSASPRAGTRRAR